MNASLRFGFRYPLHTMTAGFELEAGIGTLAFNADNDFLVTAVFPEALADDFQFPALLLGICLLYTSDAADDYFWV